MRISLIILIFTLCVYSVDVVDPSVNFISSVLTDSVIIKKSDSKKAISFEASINLDAIEDSKLKYRLEMYLETIEKMSEKYNLEVEHVLAIIHIESYFNSGAYSPAGAVGLMQLVPTSGGTEAWKIVYGVAKQPTINQLKNPKLNIELGCAYFSHLLYVTFGDIKNEESRTFCAIAAYNTGPHNVARAFGVGKSIDKAIEKVNILNNGSRVYAKLIGDLPYRETRNFLPKVNKKIAFYKQL